MKLTLEMVKKCCPEIQWQNYQNVSLQEVHFDSREVKPGDIFVSVFGRHQGNQKDDTKEQEYIIDAVQRGATVVISEDRFASAPVSGLTNNARATLSRLACLRYDNPGNHLQLAGVTGTKGKTTTTFLIRAILQAAGRPTGLLGTVKYEYANVSVSSALTTPNPLVLNMHMAKMRELGITHVSMEVSSQALAQERVEGLSFKTAVFTNISRDHLDYHKTWENYLECKSRLFSKLANDAYAVFNADDNHTNYFQQLTNAKKIFYGIYKSADVMATNLRSYGIVNEFDLVSPWGTIPITIKLPGRYNILNALAAASAALTLGVPLTKVKVGLESLTNIPGRMENIDCGQKFLVMVDYAHTDDSLTKALTTFRSLITGKLIVVFGCGGNRDQGKRKLMGQSASQLADCIWVTNDNPRNEDPEFIASQIVSGIDANKKFTVCLDRAEAVYRAIQQAQPGDGVLIAGKGHEVGQIFATHTVHFDDREVAIESLQKLGFNS